MKPDEGGFYALRESLERSHTFPCYYTFKFIMPAGIREQFVAILEEQPFSLRESSTGRYVSVTAEIFMGSSDEVVEVYRQASAFEGVIML